ncbi:hypothetical protein OGAPHI_002313 [Ogataea philodendri]|uniref:Uncharacterized protein n=1 Tax=Ogataea philodendri TaxID=1378263 RepID=A0A9P8PBQ6_9ASCO|nr:uncharacterized protein OGAPHI_002313 [Ogataea philodendri]KAH3668559.1 hypothetical protein OGAPHI_002313 [Ogataea philodendri]
MTRKRQSSTVGTPTMSETVPLVFESCRQGTYLFSEIPQWQRDNHYILSGYVRETKSFRACWDSLFYLHNETVNIITHLVPGLLFPIGLFSVSPWMVSNDRLIRSVPNWLIQIPVFDSTTRADNFIFGLFFFGFVSCLSLSAIFHATKCHSHKVMKQGSSLDYVGIICLIVTSMIGIIHYSLQDDPGARWSCIALVGLFGTVCLVLTLDPGFREPEWRTFRATMFVIFGVSSVIPIGYGLFEYGATEVWNRAGLGYVLLEGLGYISGAIIYAMRTPEKHAPGRFDIWGNSHQIFHVLVVLSAYSHLKGLNQSYIWAHSSGVMDKGI